MWRDMVILLRRLWTCVHRRQRPVCHVIPAVGATLAVARTVNDGIFHKTAGGAEPRPYAR